MAFGAVTRDHFIPRPKVRDEKKRKEEKARFSSCEKKAKSSK